MISVDYDLQFPLESYRKFSSSNFCSAHLSTSILIIFSFTASRIRYEITSGNIGGAFAVKNMTGAIYVAGALDYETRKRVSFTSFVGIFFYRSFESFEGLKDFYPEKWIPDNFSK